MNYSELKVGMSHQINHFVSTKDVMTFADFSGDKNPIHIDPEYAGQSIFGKPIIHGMIVGALFSKVIASEFPGPGSIYLHQDLNFLKPIYHNSELTITVSIQSLKVEKKIAILETICEVEGVKVIEGKAVVKCLR